MLETATYGPITRLHLARTVLGRPLYTVNAYSHGTQLPSIARSSIRAIVEKDSLACLGIDAEISSSPREPQPDDETEAPVVEVIHRTEATMGRSEGGADP